ncbi:MAG: UDP-glucose/GDP-mannose dehydrogenase family protein [Methanobacteriaceae archaeon]|nr:UDP-glucose/GDP-mannose dehydrogenase family protein [Methanobacteriaceae archaeon]MDP2836031.1 UDP-glucose/GDP-mannose dehydrogenase family protein [Methanobacteriaceae archaeon]MDP3035541.1 UDP-glucose/GDP-mannose dehydrogenase family protein [Methanobacteriaceae archaeon]MDP3485780.1 UDP-glucose/GDP-mannose dehydrogenase family protein [Methanobacteriaceae archaeon]
MNITVIGAGYVGLITAACFADLGNEVLCIEKRESTVNKLQKGESHIYEQGLTEILQKNLEEGRIRFTTNMEEAVKFSEVIFICVGTPQSDDGKADLSQVEEASRQIAEHLNGYKLIVEKSTVPVNTHQWVKKTIKRHAHEDAQFDVASNPEFLREGTGIYDFMNPDRIVVGAESDRAQVIFEELYAPFTKEGRPLLFTKPAAAELIKHASNSFLAMKISYINMISSLCEKVGVDVNTVAQGIGLDHRIGENFLNAGIGYGGSCFPKDVQAFIKIAEDHGLEFGLLKETEKINAFQKRSFLDKIEDILWINKDKNITVWGLAFKPETDDIREAPAIEITQELEKNGANLHLYDPEASDNFKNILAESDNVKYFEDKYDALKDADALLIITEWQEFKLADLKKVKELMRLPIIIDGRNIFGVDEMKEFEYYSVGR